MSVRTTIIILLAVGLLFWIGSSGTSQRVASAPTERVQDAEVDPVWEYSQQADAISGGTIKFASVRSLGEIEFGFPYQGPQRGTLTLHDHPRRREAASLSIKRGQFLCHAPCYLTVRFDDGRAWEYEAAEPEDNSSTTLFVADCRDFRNELQKAKRVRIEALFYQEGRRAFEFNVMNLRW